MTTKNLQYSAEIIFWNIVINLLSCLNRFKSYHRKMLSFLLVTIAWACCGFIIGLAVSYLITP
jgi:NADH:ubiquinone oxidoreductase subunit K